MLTATVRRSAIVTAASCYAALRLTEQAMRPTVERIWCKLSSDEALDLYAYCIVFVHDLSILSAKLAIAAGRDCRRWADAFVAARLEPVEAPAIVAPVAVEVAAPVEVPEATVDCSTPRKRRRSQSVEPVAMAIVGEAAPKRKRGRPRKNAA